MYFDAPVDRGAMESFILRKTHRSFTILHRKTGVEMLQRLLLVSLRHARHV